MRKIELNNPDILEALQRKDEQTKELNDIAAQEEKLVNRANTLMAKLAKENEKVLPLIKEELSKIELGEYEEHSRTYLGKDGDEEGKAILEIADRLEEFKLAFKNAQSNSGDSTKGDGHGGDNAAESTEGDQDNSSQG